MRGLCWTLPIAVDVRTEIAIARPREEVAAFAAEPDNAPLWYANIKGVTWKSPRPLAVGSQIEFVAEFLGRRLVYTYEVKEHRPSGFKAIAAPFMRPAMKRENRKDLCRLKELLEERQRGLHSQPSR